MVFDADTEFPGWTLDSIIGLPSTQYVWDGTPGGHGTHYYPVGSTTLVKDFTLVGDSHGGLFGGEDKPGIVSLAFNPFVVVVSQRSRPWDIITRDMLRNGVPPSAADLKAVLDKAKVSVKAPAASLPNVALKDWGALKTYKM